MAVHLHTKHGKAKGGRWNWETTPPIGDTRTYSMILPTVRVPKNYPIKGCTGRVETRTAMRVHFFHQHARDTVIIL